MNAIRLLASVFLGWGLGANDAANVFGTAVSSQMVRWRTAAVLIALFVLLGAVLDGGEGIETYGQLSNQTLASAFAVCLGAALAVAGLTLLRLPVSTSQAVVGGILGAGVFQQDYAFEGLDTVVLCWLGTPVGAGLIAAVSYPLLARLVRWLHPDFLVYDRAMRTLLVVAGIYGAYALGANNVANVTGVFFKAGAFQNAAVDERLLALLFGGASIGLGALTFSRNVMYTVGRRIIPLNAFSAFVVVLSQAITVHIYALIGVPVSTSQAVVGAVVGIGLLKGVRTVGRRVLIGVLAGWIVTPVFGGGFTYALMWGLG